MTIAQWAVALSAGEGTTTSDNSMILFQVNYLKNSDHPHGQ